MFNCKPLALLALLACGMGHATGNPQENLVLLPEKPAWSLNFDASGKREMYLLPRDQGAIKSLPGGLKTLALKEIRRIERNQAWVRKVGINFLSQSSPLPHRLKPDYEKTLQEVAVSVSVVDSGTVNPLWRHQPILAALPAHAKIHIIIPPPATRAVRKILKDSGLLPRAVIYPLPVWATEKGAPTKYSRATRWIRDTFLVGSTASGNATAYFPLAYSTTRNLALSDSNSIKTIWHDPQHAQSFPAFIRGGNVAVADNVNGERVAFLGNDEIEQNALRFDRTTGLQPPREMTLEIIKRLAGTEKINVLPNSTLLFHIDMALSFIAPGVVALLAPIDEATLGRDEIIVLTEYRKSLAAAGFRIVNIPSTAARVSLYQSPVNIVPFTDNSTGERRAIVPEYPDVEVNINSKPHSLNALIKQSYADAGITITWAEDRFSDSHGGVHCALLGLN